MLSQHFKKMIWICAIALGAVVMLAFMWPGSGKSPLTWLLLLACPLAHIFMHRHGTKEPKATDTQGTEGKKKGDSCH